MCGRTSSFVPLTGGVWDRIRSVPDVLPKICHRQVPWRPHHSTSMCSRSPDQRTSMTDTHSPSPSFVSSFSFPLLCRTLQRFPRAAGGPDGPRPRGEANLERTPFVGVLVHRVFCGGLAATGTSLELLMARTLLLRGPLLRNTLVLKNFLPHLR